MPHYIALIRKEPDTDFGVSFPDFAGCTTAGRTLAEAMKLAPEALQFHVDGLLEDRVVLPEPSELDEVMADPANRDAVATLVPLPDPKPIVERISITLDKRLREEIDARADREGMTRSSWLAAVAKRALAGEAERRRPAAGKRPRRRPGR